MEIQDVKPIAEPSAAAVTTTTFDSWDDKGNPIVSSKKQDPPKTEEPAASAAPAKEAQPEPKGESAADPGAAPAQENKDRKPGEKLSAEERISTLTAKVRRLEAEVEARERSRTPEPTPDSQQQQPAQTYGEWRKAFKPSAWTEKWAAANPQSSWEDAQAALADHLYDVRRDYEQSEVRMREGLRQTQEMLRKTVEKYPDSEPKITEAAKGVLKAPAFVQAFINDSEVLTDLLFTLSDGATLQKIVETAQTNPGKALRALRDMELAIEKEVSPPAAKVDEKPPELKPRAPKPPSEVSGRGAPSEDALVAAARANDFSAFEVEQNRRMTAGSGR